jgi:hypothetical protein
MTLIADLHVHDSAGASPMNALFLFSNSCMYSKHTGSSEMNVLVVHSRHAPSKERDCLTSVACQMQLLAAGPAAGQDPVFLIWPTGRLWPTNN